ncbi:MAG TPA: RDD family protein [Candidatus Dormibacteraeota bacterium]
MLPPDQSDDLVIATPERVAFEYEIAGIGSRFLAQVVDMAIIVVIALILTVAAIALGALLRSAQVALLFELLLGFVLIAGYFLVSEATLSGQTLGKRYVRLRVVGDQGQPLTLGQAAIRNLVRIVDFLPLFYGIGILTLFINGRGKRLGDFAAGTLVVRDRQRVSLYDLASTAPAASAPPAPAPAPAASIWSQPAGPSDAAPSPVPATRSAPPTLDPALRRLVVAYAARREALPVARREALAQSAAPALQKALPEVAAVHGPLAALDQLAEREGISPYRPVHADARRAMTFGVSTLIFFWMPLIAIPTGVLCIVFSRRALRTIRSQPDRVQGEDQARHGRLLGSIGLSIASILLLLFILAFVFRSG